MATTPIYLQGGSGMTVEEAKELSKKQQDEITANMPAEGSYFLMEAGGGVKQLYQRQGDNIIRLGWNQPADWGGRTISSWIGQATNAGLSALGLENTPTVHFDYVKGLKLVDVKDLNEFIGQTKGYGGNILPTPISPTPTETIAPENTLAGIRQVFGASWQPSPAFTPALQAKGIFGAVRVGDSPNVFTLGPGGGWETAESFYEKFKTNEQQGIVGNITKEQAIKLGINPASINAPPETNPNLITAAGLQQQKPISLPSTEGGVDEAAVIAASAQTTLKSLEDYIKLLTPPESATKKSLDKLIADYIGGLKETEGRGAAQLAEEERLGIAQKKAALTSVKNQINMKLAEFNQIQAQLQALSTDIEGRPITMASIIGAQSQIQNKLIAQKNSFAADIGLLQAQALALQGDLVSAQEAANRAVDLKYSDIETRLRNQTALIGILEGQLTKEEQIRADALKLYLNDQKDRLNRQKDVEKEIQNIMLSVVGIAPNDILAQISKAKSVLEAGQLAAPYLKEEVEQWSDPYLLGGDYVQKNLSTGEIRTAVNVPGGGGGSGGGGGGISGGKFNFTNDETGFLTSIGLNPQRLQNIESQINAQGGFDSEGLTDEQVNVIKQVVSGMTPTQIRKVQEEEKEFLTEEFIREKYTEDELFQKAKKAGKTSVWTGKTKDVQRYLDWLMEKIKAAREAGYTDKEIQKFIFTL